LQLHHGTVGTKKEGAMAQYLRYGEPRFARWLFSSTTAAWIWLVARVYLGYEWAKSGWEKVTDPAWLKTGQALKGFAGFAASELIKGDHAAVNYGWYASFLRWISNDSYPWMAKLIAVGELTVGILLILGLFTGIAAFLAGMLSFSFGLAGVAGVNPVFFLFEVLLMLAWRNAGYIGLDRFVLPALGTPWEPGTAFDREKGEARQLA
jgi:thiosulfate dehydrogenase [quinone] large subunit